MSLSEGKSLCIFPLKQLSSNHRRGEKKTKMERWECPEFLSAARFWNRNPQHGSCRPPSPWLSASALREHPSPGLWVPTFTPTAVSLAQTLLLQCEFTGVGEAIHEFQVPTHHTTDQRARSLHPGRESESLCLTPSVVPSSARERSQVRLKSQCLSERKRREGR